jgi:hypothetical protein
MKPICIPCQRFFRMAKSGAYFTEQMPIADGDSRRAEPGNAEPERWQPYKIWAGDRWICEGCHAQIIVGTGRAPVAEHYQADFAATRDRLNAGALVVNDC